jgi:hypothetical protein
MCVLLTKVCQHSPDDMLRVRARLSSVLVVLHSVELLRCLRKGSLEGEVKPVIGYAMPSTDHECSLTVHQLSTGQKSWTGKRLPGKLKGHPRRALCGRRVSGVAPGEAGQQASTLRRQRHGPLVATGSGRGSSGQRRRQRRRRAPWCPLLVGSGSSGGGIIGSGIERGMDYRVQHGAMQRLARIRPCGYAH